MKIPSRLCLLWLVLLAGCESVLADAQIGRVYHPYVAPLEREIEWRSNFSDDSGSRQYKDQKHWLAYGFSPLERWFVEAYMIAEKDNGQSLDVSGFELEGLRQLTEQGEYWADLGVLFELERETAENLWELSMAGLAEKELGPTSLTANLHLIYEFGGGINNEIETAAALQWRWRYRDYFEPAVEYYKGDGLNAIGPVGLGMFRFGRQKLKWELGPLFGIDSNTPNTTWRLLLEYEF